MLPRQLIFRTIPRNCIRRPYGKDNGSSGASGGFFKKFAEGLKDQSGKDDDLKTSVRKFEETLTEIKELESVKKAKEAFAKAKEDATRQNEAILTEVKEKVGAVKEAAGKVSSKVGDTLSTAAKPIRIIGEKVKPYVPNIAESELAQRLGKSVTDAEESLLEGTNAYKYGGYKDREARERSRLRQKPGQEGQTKATGQSEPVEPVEEDPNAGQSVVMHKTSRLAEMWSDFRDNNILLRKFHGVKQRYDESNNVFVFFMREFTGSIAGRLSSIFAETETAKALREISLRDPTFNLENFMKDAHEHLIPEILDALLCGDLPTLRLWSSEATFNMLKATFEGQLKAGHRMEGRVLDLRHIEIVTAKLLDDTPVVVVTFTTQQISLVRDSTGAIVEGREDKVENVNYVMALAKEETFQPDSPTKGWKLLEIAIRPGGGW